ncbi:MAG: substrate-binding domain-containing protein [Candidatus Humimicrobiaceae bacterium]
MKKYIIIVLLCIFVLTVFIGCKTTTTTTAVAETTAAAETTAVAETTAASKEIKVGVTISNRDQFLTTYENYVIEAAKAAGNVKVVSFDAQNDVQKQFEHLNTFVTQKFDVIVLIAANTDTVPDMLKIVGDIPVVVAFRMPSGMDITDVLRPGDAYVGSQNLVAGQMQAEFLTKYFKAKGQTEINYVMLIGDLGAEVSVERTRGALEGLAAAGFKLNKVLEDTAGWDRAKAMSMMETLLGTDKVIDCVITNNDEMALGAYEAIKTTGKFLGIPVVGVDATDAALESIKKGEMAMTVLLDAETQANKTIEIAINMATGKAFEAVNWIPYRAVTIENVDEFMKK